MLRARGKTQIRPCANVAAAAGRPLLGRSVAQGAIEIRHGIDVVPRRAQRDRQPVCSRDGPSQLGSVANLWSVDEPGLPTLVGRRSRHDP